MQWNKQRDLLGTDGKHKGLQTTCDFENLQLRLSPESHTLPQCWILLLIHWTSSLISTEAVFCCAEGEAVISGFTMHLQSQMSPVTQVTPAASGLCCQHQLCCCGSLNICKNWSSRFWCWYSGFYLLFLRIHIDRDELYSGPATGCST